MSAISTLESLAQAVGLDASVSRGRELTVRQADIDGPLLLDSLSADRLALQHVEVDGMMAIRSCVIEELVIDHCRPDALLITNSRIGRLVVRNAPVNCEIAVNETTVETLDIHSCASLRFEGLRAADTVQIAGVRGPVHLKRVRAAALTIRSQITAGRQARPDVHLENVRVAEAVSLDDLWLSALVLEDIDAAALVLRRVRVDVPFHGTGVRCREGLRINGMVVPGEAEQASVLSDSDVRGAVEVRGLRHPMALPEQRTGPDPGVAPVPPPARTAELAFRSTTISRLTVAADDGSPLVLVLDNTTINEALAMPQGPARYRLAGSSSIREVELGDAVFRTGGQAISFLERVFTRVTPGALEALRATLAHRRRTAEEDQVYYLTRQQETVGGPLLRRWVARGLLGGVLGWGVRARNPARTLAGAVLATGVGLHLAGRVRGPGSAGLGSAVSAGKALILACALWLNIGTGAPSELKTYDWTALAVCFALGGLLFTTLTVGIVIRKLVR